MATEWVRFVETGSRTKKQPDGSAVYVRLSDISVIMSYEDGSSTIGVNGFHYHVEDERTAIMDLMDARIVTA